MDYLDKLTTLLGCNYMSDIRRTTITKTQADEIMNITAGDYTLADYSDAANYILEKSLTFKSVDDAKKAIVDKLMQASSN